MDELLKDIGNELNRLRKEAGFPSYTDFAWAHGLSKTHYGRLEKGTNCTIKSLYRIMAIHKLSLADFFILVQESPTSTQTTP